MADPASPSVGRYIAEAFRDAGVDRAFTVPGESFLGLLEELEGAGIRVIAARHEGGAGFMAEAYGQLTGRPALLLVTRAVGAANASIAIHTALSDSSPLIVLVGQIPRRFHGREAFQEVDQVETFGRLAKFAAEPRTPDEVVDAVATAISTATSGRPGPVLLALPEDLLDEPAPVPAACVAEPAPPAAPTPADVRSVLDLLAAAERPVVLAGAGVLRAGATDAFARFVEALDVPVITSWRRADLIDNDHPLYLGMTGYWAPKSVLERLLRADAMLVIGCRLNDPTSFGYRVPPSGIPWAHVDLEPTRPDVSLEPATLAITADAGAFLEAAEVALADGYVPDDAVRRRRRANVAIDRDAWRASTIVDAAPWNGPGVHPGRVVSTLQRVLPRDAVITTDAGNFAGWSARGFRFHEPGTFLGPTSGAMGYALPAAIAAAVVHPERVVVAVAGDGGLGMTLSEMETAVRAGTRVIVLCHDNQRYGTIRMWQERRGRGQGVATEFGPVDFAMVARGLGASGERVESDAEFEPALERALAASGPTLLHLMVDRAWVSVDSTPAQEPARP